MRTDERRKIHIAYGVFFACVFAVMFLLSLLTPLVADDYNYVFGFANNQRISGLRDIWDSMAWHRKLLNGRVFSHGWLNLVLMFPRWVFAALNGLVAVFFSWTTLGFCRDQGSRHPLWASICVWMLLWICMPGFGQVFFWTAGACNYFWGFAFAWFMIWRAVQLGQNGDHRRLRTGLLLAPAFVAGAWSEHISFTMLMAMFLILVRLWKRVRRFPWANALVLASGCAGYLYLMLAPATKLIQRLQGAGDPAETDNLTRILERIPEKVIHMVPAGIILMTILIIVLWRCHGARFTAVTLSAGGAAAFGLATVMVIVSAGRTDGIYGIISSSLAGFLFPLCSFCIVLCNALRQNTDSERVTTAMILSFSGMCAIVLFLFGEYFPIRGFCAPVSMLVLSTVYLFDAAASTAGRVVKRVMACLIIICFAACFFLGVQDILLVHREAVSREAFFTEAAAGDKIVVVTPYVYHTKYTAQYGNPDLSYDAGWPNGVMADYYDVVRIIVVEA